MSKKSSKKFHFQPRDYKADIQFKTRGNRYFIRASGRTEDLDTKEDQIPTSWKVEYQDDKRMLLSTLATRQTDFTILGQKIFILRFKDGRKIRFNKDDFPERVLRKLNKIVKD